MSTTQLDDINAQIQTKWSKVAMQELRESFILPNLVSKKYEGEIREQNDTVRIYQVNAPTSELKVVGSNEDTFTANKLSTSYVDLVANRRAVSAYKFNDLIEVQSILDPANNPEIRMSLMHDIGRQINTYLYSLMVPSTSSPDHTIGSTAAMSNTIMANMREAAALAHWPKNETWYHLMSPQYMSDFLADSNMTNADYGFNDQARIFGQPSLQRYGFTNFEDDSVTAASSIAFVPSALLYAAQYEPRIKVSDLHPLGQFGYQMSIDIVFGAKLSIDGDEKCYKVTAAA
jgi:hypothetical protein